MTYSIAETYHKAPNESRGKNRGIGIAGLQGYLPYAAPILPPVNLNSMSTAPAVIVVKVVVAQATRARFRSSPSRLPDQRALAAPSHVVSPPNDAPPAAAQSTTSLLAGQYCGTSHCGTPQRNRHAVSSKWSAQPVVSGVRSALRGVAAPRRRLRTGRHLELQPAPMLSTVHSRSRRCQPGSTAGRRTRRPRTIGKYRFQRWPAAVPAAAAGSWRRRTRER